MSDAAAALQMAYDQAVNEHGPDSQQAHDAEREALQFFQRVRLAPVEPAFNESEQP